MATFHFPGLYVAAWWLYVMYRVWIGVAIPELHMVAIDAILFLIFGMVALLAIIIIALMERERKEGTDNGC